MSVNVSAGISSMDMKETTDKYIRLFRFSTRRFIYRFFLREIFYLLFILIINEILGSLCEILKRFVLKDTHY